jgi:dTDP-glucose pyrophosphorylase
MVEDKPLFAWAMDGLPLDLSRNITIITNENVAKFPTFDVLLKKFLPRDLEITIEVLDKQTSGQAETVLKGTNNLSNKNGLLIFNCDTWISDDFPRDFEKWDGLLGTFYSSNPTMSYLEVNGKKVLRTVEKEVISNKASTGLYYFASKEIFLNAYNSTDFASESFIAPIYNSMIRNDLQVGHFKTLRVIPMGTTDEISSFHSAYKKD